MEIKHYFTVRKVEMSDNSDLWELITPGAERVATASREELLTDLEMTLNLALTDAEEASTDIVVDV